MRSRLHAPVDSSGTFFSLQIHKKNHSSKVFAESRLQENYSNLYLLASTECFVYPLLYFGSSFVTAIAVVVSVIGSCFFLLSVFHMV